LRKVMAHFFFQEGEPPPPPGDGSPIKFVWKGGLMGVFPNNIAFEDFAKFHKFFPSSMKTL
jgi:hypothetical protein